jgi:glycerophosphoryl diester phosphodiesterase
LFLNPVITFTHTAENTKASFIEACKAGADGIETGKSKCHEDHEDHLQPHFNLHVHPAYSLSDIHIAKDNVLVLFHDPELGRTTTGSGKIHEQPWAGVLE